MTDGLGQPRSCARLGEAARAGKAEVDAGRATLAFVVAEEPDGSRHVVHSATCPAAAAKIILHLVELEESLGSDE